MTALPNAAPAPVSPATGAPLVGVLRVLLLAQALAGLLLAILLSLLAPGMSSFLDWSTGAAAETTLRFGAGAAFLFAIFAAVASRGCRRRRAWAWTLAAILQVVLAIGTGVVVMTADWHPAYLAGFALAAVTMVVLSTAPVRHTLGQG